MDCRARGGVLIVIHTIQVGAVQPEITGTPSESCWLVLEEASERQVGRGSSAAVAQLCIGESESLSEHLENGHFEQSPEQWLFRRNGGLSTMSTLLVTNTSRSGSTSLLAARSDISVLDLRDRGFGFV